jgi:hypothetical protein
LVDLILQPIDLLIAGSDFVVKFVDHFFLIVEDGFEDVVLLLYAFEGVAEDDVLLLHVAGFYADLGHLSIELFVFLTIFAAFLEGLGGFVEEGTYVLGI